MPNYCDYTMKITGRKENIIKLVDILNANYNYSNYEFSCDRHFCRIFEAEPSEDLNNLNPVDKHHSIYELFVTGYCAWSVYSCMFGGEHSYYDSFRKEYGDKSKATTIDKEAKRLNLLIEITSEEEGMEFAEYYLLTPKGLVNEKCVGVTFKYNEDDELEEVIGGFRDYKFKEFSHKDFKNMKHNPNKNKERRKRRKRRKRKIKK